MEEKVESRKYDPSLAKPSKCLEGKEVCKWQGNRYPWLFLGNDDTETEGNNIQSV
jgi:hypothetical protein